MFISNLEKSVLLVNESNNHSWFLNESRKKAKEYEKEVLVQNIVDIISARKHRDLFDILTKIEQSSGWSTAIDYLIESKEGAYSYNMGSEGPSIQLEPLKYRESIFNLFDCGGLEPIAIDTIALLEEINNERSFVDAINKFTHRVEEMVWDQINIGDLLFFSPPYYNTRISNNLKNNLANLQKEKINNLVLREIEDKINIEQMWYSELGRQALSSLGIKGLYLSQNELSQVLSVIQVSPQPRPKILHFNKQKTKQYEHIAPSHKDYRLLLNSIINQDFHDLGCLGSKHSTSVFNCILYDTLKNYEINTSSDNYQNLLTMINYHIIVRALDSIPTLKQLCQLKDERIAIVSIIAIGNFFHDSTVFVLAELACNKRNNEVVNKALTVLEVLSSNYPEAISIIEEILETNCINYSKLKNLHKKITEK